MKLITFVSVILMSMQVQANGPEDYRLVRAKGPGAGGGTNAADERLAHIQNMKQYIEQKLVSDEIVFLKSITPAQVKSLTDVSLKNAFAAMLYDNSLIEHLQNHPPNQLYNISPTGCLRQKDEYAQANIKIPICFDLEQMADRIPLTTNTDILRVAIHGRAHQYNWAVSNLDEEETKHDVFGMFSSPTYTSPSKKLATFRCSATCALYQCKQQLSANWLNKTFLGGSGCIDELVSSKRISKDATTPNEAFEKLFDECNNFNGDKFVSGIEGYFLALAPALYPVNAGIIASKSNTGVIKNICEKVSYEPEIPDDIRKKIPREDYKVCEQKHMRHQFIEVGGDDYVLEEWTMSLDVESPQPESANQKWGFINFAKNTEQAKLPGTSCYNFNTNRIGPTAFSVTGTCDRKIKASEFQGKVCL